MSRFELRVGAIVIETEAEAIQLRAAEPRIQEAFRLFAERLERTPFRPFGEARELVIENLRLSTLPLDELLGPRGAERLADALYRELTRRIGK
jgi:hypothetical protein